LTDLIQRYNLNPEELREWARENCPEIRHSLNLVAQIYLAKEMGIKADSIYASPTKASEFSDGDVGEVVLFLGSVKEWGYRGRESRRCPECWRVVKQGQSVCPDHPDATVIGVNIPTLIGTDGESKREYTVQPTMWGWLDKLITLDQLQFRKVKARAKYSEYKGIPQFQIQEVLESEPYIEGLGSELSEDDKKAMKQVVDYLDEEDEKEDRGKRKVKKKKIVKKPKKKKAKKKKRKIRVKG
jgi:hypothetical protein